MRKARPKNPAPPKGSVSEVFRAFLVLGLTSFGGPVAHIGFFRNAFVLRRKWLDDRAFADLINLVVSRNEFSRIVGRALRLAEIDVWPR